MSEDNDKVICPHCTHAFIAIPVSAQARIAALEGALTEIAPRCRDYGCSHDKNTEVILEAQARIAALEETAVSAAKACFWSNVGGGRVVSRQASPDEIEAAIRAALAKGDNK